MDKDKVTEIFEQLKRLHEAIDDLYDSAPKYKTTSDNYMRCEDEYRELSDMLVKQLVHRKEIDYVRSH